MQAAVTTSLQRHYNGRVQKDREGAERERTLQHYHYAEEERSVRGGRKTTTEEEKEKQTRCGKTRKSRATGEQTKATARSETQRGHEDLSYNQINR